MNKALMQRMARREQLILQTASQRTLLAQQINQLRLPLAIADQGFKLFSMVRKHPTWIASGMLVLMVLKPARAVSGGTKWIRIAWITFQAIQKLRNNKQRAMPQAIKTSQISLNQHD